MKQFSITEDAVGQRLDVFAASKFPQLSRASIQKLSVDKQILVNSEPVKPSYKLRAGDRVRVNYDPSTQAPPEIDLPVIYEDETCFVINKPTGLLTHSKGAFNPEATIATFAHQKAPTMEGERAGIVHRLDRATSGVMIVAKTPESLTWLQKQFSLRSVVKTYHAIVAGQLDPPAAIIDMPIERHPRRPQTFRVGSGGKTAQTRYRTLRTRNGYSLLELTPQTGRTHQLRVHLAHLGHPIMGDTVYGGQPAKRLYLHATSLTLKLPNGQQHSFIATLPAVFKKLEDL